MLPNPFHLNPISQCNWQHHKDANLFAAATYARTYREHTYPCIHTHHTTEQVFTCVSKVLAGVDRCQASC